MNTLNTSVKPEHLHGLPGGIAPSMAAGISRPHESAAAQVAGGATYIDDIPEVRGTLQAAPILSNVAHGRLLGVDDAEPGRRQLRRRRFVRPQSPEPPQAGR